MLEGNELIIFTGHKPLTFTFGKIGSHRETERRARQIMFISEFSTDIRHLNGLNNIVADTLSRIETITCPTTICFAELAAAQEGDGQLAKLIEESNNSPKFMFKRIMLTECDKYVVCEMSTDKARPYLPKEFRYEVFNSIHSLKSKEKVS